MNKRISRIVARHLKKSSEMNLITNYDDTMFAMAELEGEGWFLAQLEATETKNLTVPHALKTISRSQAEIADYEKDLETETDPEEIEYLENMLKRRKREVVGDAIYGSGGGHRYFVKADGTVVFSGMHATREDIEKAKALGFSIW